MILVTGGAGFIGSAIVWRLNQLGIHNILIVDRLGKSEKWKNLVSLKFQDYMEVDEFERRFFAPAPASPPMTFDTIFHMGACSSTTESDASYLVRNNFIFSKHLALMAHQQCARFIYASSAATYGDGARGYSDDERYSEKLLPLNMYGYSKQMFDQWMLSTQLKPPIKFAGLKFFNVYGPNEYHKGSMMSLVPRAVQQVQQSGVIRLFKSHKTGVKDGEQLRDFIYIKDVVEMTLYFKENPHVSGLFNIGTGTARSFLDLANAVFRAMKKSPAIEYIPMPEAIRDKYQYFTQADMTKLRHVGFKAVPYSLEAGVEDYVRHYLLTQSPHLRAS